MVRRILFIVSLSVASVLFWFQDLPAQSPLRRGKATLNYSFQQEGGTNACAVVWVPEWRQYVTVIAGNDGFPMEFFDENGSMVGGRTVGLDIRGLWYKKGKLFANGAGESGWFSIPLNGALHGDDWNSVKEGMNQPDFQSVMTSTGNSVVAFNGNSLHFYNTKGKFKKEVELKGYPELTENLNYTTVAYTGNASFPLALLNSVEFRVEFFNLKGEYLTSTDLEQSRSDLDVSAFRFSFANGLAWLYDIDTRTWVGYKVFN